MSSFVLVTPVDETTNLPKNPVRKIAILSSNIYEIRPVFTNVPASAAVQAQAAVPAVEAKPEVLDSSGKVVTPAVAASPAKPAVAAVPASDGGEKETGSEIAFINGKLRVAETVEEIMGAAG